MTAHHVRAIAVEAVCDTRTVESYLRGHSVRGASEIRIRAAMVRLELEDHLPAAAGLAKTGTR